MSPIAPAQLLDALDWRYAVKAFDPSRRIPAETWAALERSLVLTPSSFGLQPWRFLVVTDPQLRQRLKAASWNQPQVVDASHHLVFLARTVMTEADVQKLIDRITVVRGVPAASIEGYRQMMIKDVVHGPRGRIAREWAIRQCYIALGQFMASCAVLGVDACPMEGFDPDQYDQILGLTDSGWTAAIACPVGYRSENDKYGRLTKVRYPLEDLIERR